MIFPLPDDQRKQFTAFLTHQRAGVISTTAGSGVSAVLVRYRPLGCKSGNRSLKLDCLVPRWSDVAHHLAGEAEVVLIVQGSSGGGRRWLKIQGGAKLVESTDWTSILPNWFSTLEPGALYLVARVTPHRIDLVDEDQGWGVQGTLEW
jgi:general stress protein 26